MYIDHFPFAARPLNLETPKATEEVEAPLKKVPLPACMWVRSGATPSNGALAGQRCLRILRDHQFFFSSLLAKPSQ